MYDTASLLREQGHEIALIVTSKEAADYSRTADDFRDLAGDIGCPFIRTARISERVDDIKSLPPIDIAVSVNYAGVIPQPVIDCFELGILNAHGGDLPRYRGNACQAWAILNGESRIGLCIHRMVGGELDSGDIVAREFHPVDIDTNVTEVWSWMQRRSPALFLEAVERLSEDRGYILERQSADPADALRCYPRRPEDGRIDWTRSAPDVVRLVNASSRPYAGAFCDLEGEPVTVWRAALLEDGERFLAIPGQVTALGDAGIDVACGTGKVRILELTKRDGSEASPVVTSLRARFS